MSVMPKSKKRSFRKAKGKKKGRRGPPRQPVHYFKRNTYAINAVTSSATTDTFQSVSFQLADVPNFTEFTSLYDQYQIQSIKYTILPRFNSVSIGDAVPETWTIIDKDGSISSNLNTYLQYPGLVIKRGAATHTRIFKPTPLALMFNGVTSGYATPKSGTWIDTTNPSVPHFGLGIATPVSGPSAPAWDVRVEYRLAFKGVR